MKQIDGYGQTVIAVIVGKKGIQVAITKRYHN